MDKSYKFIIAITAFFSVILLVSNITASKIIVLGPLSFDGGTLFFPLSYILGDVLTEVYGYKITRRVIWTGFFLSLFAMLSIMLVGVMPAAPEWGGQEAFDAILGLTPRIIFASLCAYIVGEFMNSFVLAKMKILTKGKHLLARLIGSSILGEGLDTLIFVFVAFSGVFENGFLWTMIISNFIFKIGIEIVFAPATYWLVGWLKKREHEDYYDYKTDFNPFRLK
jgi:queuosine precursor transporter